MVDVGIFQIINFQMGQNLSLKRRRNMSTGAATAASARSATSITTTGGATSTIESQKLGDKTLVVHFLSFLICFTNKTQKRSAVVYEGKTASSN